MEQMILLDLSVEIHAIVALNYCNTGISYVVVFFIILYRFREVKTLTRLVLSKQSKHWFSHH